jgi:UDP-N-acetylglucosamine--N-acetylmuramyl-(pentapeptide) pyrophosphoryl-undecaprenol N-acetylglucosamine transferase
MKILFTGGGTGGHIFPIIAIVRQIKKTAENQQTLRLYYLGANDKIGSAFLLEREGVKVKIIFSGKIRRYFTPLSFLLNLFDIFFKIPLGILQAFFQLFILAPDLIFSKGGYGSLPVVISGWLLQIPIFLHESDIEPGFANKILGKFALEIFVSFPETKGFPPEKILVVGNPIRKEILEGSLKEAKEIFHLTGEKPVILIMGGSQGAQKINDLILDILPEWLKHFELIHITGPRHYERIKKEAEVIILPEFKKYYHPVGFLEEAHLRHAYKACNFIVSRAGAGSIFEIAAIGKPSILIPLPGAARDHQLKNAYALARAGGTIVIEQANLTPHFLLERIRYLFGQPEDFKRIAQKALDFAKPKAAEIIASYIVSYLRG